jgi:hypothetical protein
LVEVDDGLLGDPVNPSGTGHHRDTRQLAGVELDQMGRHLDDDTLNAPLQQGGHAVGNAARGQVGHRHQRHGVAEPTRLVLEGEHPPGGADQTRPQGQHADRVRPFPGERLGGDVRAVTEFLDGPANPLAHIGANVWRVVDHPGHRLLGHTGQTGDVNHDHTTGAPRAGRVVHSDAPLDYVVRFCQGSQTAFLRVVKTS